MADPSSMRAAQSASRPRLRVAFLLLRRFTLCAFANFVDVLRLAADEGDRSRPILCEWTILCDGSNTVTSSCGVVVRADAGLAAPSEFDYVVVVGGLLSESPYVSPTSIRFLQDAAAQHATLVGVCTGAFVLHKAGLMDGYRCCVSWFHHADFLDRFDGLTPVSDQIFVIDRDRLTCSGGVSSAHLAAHLVAKHISASAAQKSLQIMIIPEALRGETSQPGVPVRFAATDDAVRKAMLHMRQNLEEPLAIDVIAERLEMSRRSLERRFARALGRTPAACYLDVRLDQAELMLVRTNQSIATIAVATGFCDGSHLTRAFKRHRGVTPVETRRGSGARNEASPR